MYSNQFSLSFPNSSKMGSENCSGSCQLGNGHQSQGGDEHCGQGVKLAKETCREGPGEHCVTV